MAGDIPVAHTRVGDYLVRGDWVSNPGYDPAEEVGWSLKASHGATLRLAVDGPGAGHARLDIYDLRGRRLLSLHEGPLAAGPREFIWAGEDQRNRRLASGLYFARLSAGEDVRSAKILLLR